MFLKKKMLKIMLILRSMIIVLLLCMREPYRGLSRCGSRESSPGDDLAPLSRAVPLGERGGEKGKEGRGEGGGKGNEGGGEGGGGGKKGEGVREGGMGWG